MKLADHYLSEAISKLTVLRDEIADPKEREEVEAILTDLKCYKVKRDAPTKRKSRLAVEIGSLLEDNPKL